jgi:uncharacterized membrane protein
MIPFHLSFALGALLLGVLIMVLRKGTSLHRILGRTWAAAMLAVALSSFWIRSSGGFSWIHLLSAWTVIALACAVYFIRRGNVKAHRRFMVGTLLGLAGAGLGALAPGRLLNAWLFSA